MTGDVRDEKRRIETTDDRTYPERLMDVTDEQLAELLRFWSEAENNLALWMVARAFLSDVQREVTRRSAEQEGLSYPYDDDCYCPDGPPGSEPGWWCPGGHKSYRDDCWMCRY